MTKTEIEEKVKVAYASCLERYGWRAIEVGKSVNVIGGRWIVVRGLIEGRKTLEEEVCFLSDDGEIEIFQTTNELILRIEKQASRTLTDRLLNKSGLAALVMIFILVVLGIIGVSSKDDKQVIQIVLYIIGGIVFSAVGYLFGKVEKF